jgi:hypothetical protein
MPITMNWNQIIPVSDNLAKVRLRTIDNKNFIMSFMTEEDLKNMPQRVTVSKIMSINRVQKVI